MKPKSSAHYQREYRKRLRDKGLIKKEVWILPEHTPLLSAYEKKLREIDPNQPLIEVKMMAESSEQWTTETCFNALKKCPRFSCGDASIELIEGITPSIYIQMHDFGDLPIYCTISGAQIIVESVLWAMHDIKNKADFNEMVLRSHKYFPLSTICLEKGLDGCHYYFMFGSLSSRSKLSNILFEIETLADNTINATDAYIDFLKTPDSILGETK